MKHPFYILSSNSLNCIKNYFGNPLIRLCVNKFVAFTWIQLDLWRYFFTDAWKVDDVDIFF